MIVGAIILLVLAVVIFVIVLLVIICSIEKSVNKREQEERNIQYILGPNMPSPLASSSDEEKEQNVPDASYGPYGFPVETERGQFDLYNFLHRHDFFGRR